MTHEQWLFEAEALRKKAKQEAESQHRLVENVFSESVRAFREILVSVLGVNIGAGKREEGKPTPFTPLVVFTGRPEVLEEMIKRQTEEAQAVEVLDSPGHDELNDQLMGLEAGDLEPIFSGANSDDPFERWYSPQVQGMLADLGIETETPDETAQDSD